MMKYSNISMKYSKSGRFWEDMCPTCWIAGANESNTVLVLNCWMKCWMKFSAHLSFILHIIKHFFPIQHHPT